MDFRLNKVNDLIDQIRNLFKCNTCSLMKNEDVMVYYWDCEHLFCLGCVSSDESCIICSTKDGIKRGDKYMKITQNENIVAVFRSVSNYKDTCEGLSFSKNNNEPQMIDKNACESVSFSPNSEQKNLNKNVKGGELQRKIKKNLNISKRNHKGETRLHLACRKGDLILMQELIDAGADPNVQDNAGWTPLHDSVVFGRVDVIKFLLQNGARVNTPGHENVTALHQSVIEGNAEVTRLLLKYGADKGSRNIYGETPIDLIKKFDIKGLEEIMMNTPAKLKPSILREVTNKNISKSEMVLYAFNLNKSEAMMFGNFTATFEYKTIDKLSPHRTASHIIVSNENEPCMSWDIIGGVLMGCYIISVDWMKDSLEKHAIQSPERYEVKDTFYSGFLKSRYNQINQLPTLFSGCHFYFGGNFELYRTKTCSFLKSELKLLVEKNGGVILTRNPDPESLALEKTIPYHANSNGSLAMTSYYIIYCECAWNPVPKYNMAHMKTLPVEWLLASIFKFELIDPNAEHSYMNDI